MFGGVSDTAAELVGVTVLAEDVVGEPVAPTEELGVVVDDRVDSGVAAEVPVCDADADDDAVSEVLADDDEEPLDDGVLVTVEDRVAFEDAVVVLVLVGEMVLVLLPVRVTLLDRVCDRVAAGDGVPEDDTDALALEVADPDADELGVPVMVALGVFNGSRETLALAVSDGDDD